MYRSFLITFSWLGLAVLVWNMAVLVWNMAVLVWNMAPKKSLAHPMKDWYMCSNGEMITRGEYRIANWKTNPYQYHLFGLTSCKECSEINVASNLKCWRLSLRDRSRTANELECPEQETVLHPWPSSRSESLYRLSYPSPVLFYVPNSKQQF
jgi:hypothetical protein